jgi:hypothetical protein
MKDKNWTLAVEAGGGRPRQLKASFSAAEAAAWQDVLAAQFPGEPVAIVPVRATCVYCDAPATTFADPPVCWAHLDLTILADFMARRGLALTPDNARGLLLKSVLAGWRVTPTDLAELWPAFIQKRQEQINGR